MRYRGTVLETPNLERRTPALLVHETDFPFEQHKIFVQEASTETLRGSELDIMSTWHLKDPPSEKIWIPWKEVKAARDRRKIEQRTERNFVPGAVITFFVKPTAQGFIDFSGYLEGTHPQFEDEQDEKDWRAEQPTTQPLPQQATCAASHWSAAGSSAQQAAYPDGMPKPAAKPTAQQGVQPAAPPDVKADPPKKGRGRDLRKKRYWGLVEIF